MLSVTLLFNLGQGALRPSLPLYLQHVFGANYRMVTLIPVVFGAGKWVASLPTGYWLDELGRRRLMMAGLSTIALCDVASVWTPTYPAFLAARGVAGMGWAMFGTVAITTMVNRPEGRGRGRAISLLLMSESGGLLLGSILGGALYQGVGKTAPFVFEAATLVLAATVVGLSEAPPPEGRAPATAPRDGNALAGVLRTRGVLLMTVTNGMLAGLQTGVLVFLFPLYLAAAGGARPEVVGYFVGLGILGRLGALWLVGALSDRRDPVAMLGLGLLGYGIVLGSVPLVTGSLPLGFLSVIIGAGAGLWPVFPPPSSVIGSPLRCTESPLAGCAP